MKRWIGLLAILTLSLSSLAQTPTEIISRMEEEMNKHEKDGISLTMDVKIPIVGSISTLTHTKDKKARMEAEVKGVRVITWIDGENQWIYNTKDNEVVIEKTDPTKADKDGGDAAMLTGIADGYDVSISKETPQAWYLLCKKSKDNKDKDDPKTMDLVVAKGTYYPVSLSAKLSGVTLTLRDISFGVTEKQVSFNAADFPDVKITDKR